LKLQYDEPLSNFALNFNLRRCTKPQPKSQPKSQPTTAAAPASVSPPVALDADPAAGGSKKLVLVVEAGPFRHYSPRHPSHFEPSLLAASWAVIQLKKRGFNMGWMTWEAISARP
jgi:hypothetical protein